MCGIKLAHAPVVTLGNRGSAEHERISKWEAAAAGGRGSCGRLRIGVRNWDGQGLTSLLLKGSGLRTSRLRMDQLSAATAAAASPPRRIKRKWVPAKNERKRSPGKFTT